MADPPSLNKSDRSDDGVRAKRVMFVGNDPTYFVTHRLPLARAAQDAGYEVHVAAPLRRNDADLTEALAPLSFHLHDVPFARGRGTIAGELRTFRALLRVYRNSKPDIVHHFTLKPVLYGSLAASLARVPHVVNAMTGLGYLFIAEGRRARARRAAVGLALRAALGMSRAVTIVQNGDDAILLTALCDLHKPRLHIIRGSGVDLAAFTPVPEPAGVPVVMFPARMLLHKGIREFVDAARLLRSAGVAARFVLVGDTDPANPATLSPAALHAYAAEGIVEWQGERRDMWAALASAAIVCLPSYREGVPKVLLEALATGRAIVTTDAPGCRETVVHGVTGLLVPARDAGALATALRRLIEDPPLRRGMGHRGRRLAEEQFGSDRVAQATIDIYRRLSA
jgi:glycosyltransferase involved in cell wall biosynthesis